MSSRLSIHGSAVLGRCRHCVRGAWDLAFTGGLVVEFDEELHFNRYRAQTLLAFRASALPWQADYLDYCTRFEQQCLIAGRWGRRWTTRPCEAIFGPPVPGREPR